MTETNPPLASDDGVQRPSVPESETTGTNATIAAIVAALAPDFPRVDAATRDVVLADVTAFVASQVRALPDFLRGPYRLALVGFEWLPVLRFGRSFVGLDPARRRAYVDLWTDAPLGLMRNVVKLIRSCALLAYYDHPALQAALRAQARRATIAAPALVLDRALPAARVGVLAR